MAFKVIQGHSSSDGSYRFEAQDDSLAQNRALSAFNVRLFEEGDLSVQGTSIRLRLVRAQSRSTFLCYARKNIMASDSTVHRVPEIDNHQ